MNDSDELDFILDASPITFDNFFESHYYTHFINLYDDDKETRLDESLAFVSDADIEKIENQFEIRLPETLRTLYLKQNGGAVDQLVVPRVANPTAENEEDWLFPFSGYDDLYPLENLRTVFDSVEDYADDENEPEMFPKMSKRLIILAQWYRHTLFLDYRNTSEPRLGFVDFDEFGDLQNDDWESQTQWWDSFEAFFSQLKRAKYDV